MPNSSEFRTKLDRFRNDFEELVTGLQVNRVVFFVGAGISRGSPTNIETAKELVQKLKDKFGNYDWWRDYFNPAEPSSQIKFYDAAKTIPKLEEIAELFLRRNDSRTFIDSVMEEKLWETKPGNICHTVLGELLIEEVCEGVLTTNLDDRIEQQHRTITTRSGPNVISHDDFLIDKEHRNDIYKVHGCLYKCADRK